MPTLLIDTHALLWWLADDRRLPPGSRDQIANPETRVLVSAASAWEVSIKKSLGKLRAPGNFLAAVENGGFDWIPVTPAEAYFAGELPRHHRDPFDRLLVSQALQRSILVLSQDAVFDRYGVSRSWK